MFVIVDCFYKVVNPDCKTCEQHLRVLNDKDTSNKVKPLLAKNLNTHLHFSHGWFEVVDRTR